MNIDEENIKCTLHQRKLEGSPLDLLRTDGRFKNVTKDVFLKFLNQPPDVDMLKEGKTLHKFSEQHKVLYALTKPPIVSAREQIVNFEYLDLPDDPNDPRKGRRLVSVQSVDHPDYPIKSIPVRTNIFKVNMHWNAPDGSNDLCF